MPLRDRHAIAPTISRGEVHIWSIALNGPSSFVNALFRLLSSDEQNRASRLLEHLQNRFVTARGMLRVVLSYYLDFPPEKIVFKYTDEGKPVLASKTMGRRRKSELNFNLSHSNDLALYAITVGREVGVDVEQVMPVPELEIIVEQNFSPAEFDDFKSISPEKKLEAFYRHWTRKEAYAKAIGKGLSIPLDSLGVSLEPRSPIPFTRLHTAPSGISDWVLHDLCPSLGYIGSLAFKGPDAPVYMWTFASAVEAFELLNRGRNSPKHSIPKTRLNI